ncbi:hypothetical protein [Spirillospora albida]|uniref:hypothetical protein n=1 Tax=Spirillospora albida TaxID=58123 RepID=UPI0004C25B44|nr:hypothetical protein [Spirillospora albida]
MSETPRIDGWRVTREGEVWRAARADFLTHVQLRYGCQLTVTASTVGELRLLCGAEDLKADVVTMAENLAAQITAAEAKRVGGETA